MWAKLAVLGLVVGGTLAVSQRDSLVTYLVGDAASRTTITDIGPIDRTPFPPQHPIDPTPTMTDRTDMIVYAHIGQWFNKAGIDKGRLSCLMYGLTDTGWFQITQLAEQTGIFLFSIADADWIDTGKTGFFGTMRVDDQSWTLAGINKHYRYEGMTFAANSMDDMNSIFTALDRGKTVLSVEPTGLEIIYHHMDGTTSAAPQPGEDGGEVTESLGKFASGKLVIPLFGARSVLANFKSCIQAETTAFRTGDADVFVEMWKRKRD